MSFVVIEKHQASVPSDQDITKAMTESGGTGIGVQGSNASKRVDYTGLVNHTTFENKLIAVAKGKRASWNFTWADAPVSVNGNGVSAGAGRLGATQYEIDITMSEDTLTQLHDEGYVLYGFKAVQATQGGGRTARPLVWFSLPSPDYSALTQVIWSVQYQAYTSVSTSIAKGHVEASFSVDIDLDQTLNVTDTGEGPVIDVGVPHAISIHNISTTPFVCGISQQAADGKPNPMCAFPLHGGGLDVIAPIEKVLLMFSTLPVNTGTVIEQAYGPGVLVDLTSLNQRAIGYDIDKGWSWGGFSWAQSVPANADLVPLLIEPGSGLPGAAIQPRSLVAS